MLQVAVDDLPSMNVLKPGADHRADILQIPTTCMAQDHFNLLLADAWRKNVWRLMHKIAVGDGREWTFVAVLLTTH